MDRRPGDERAREPDVRARETREAQPRDDGAATTNPHLPLGRMDLAARTHSVLALQRTAGNRAILRRLQRMRRQVAVARITDEALDARASTDATPAPAGSGDAALVRVAVASGDVGDIKAIDSFSSATEAERLVFLDHLAHQTWAGPRDEAAMVRIWNSFGNALLTVADRPANRRLWADCVDKGMDVGDITALSRVRDTFQTDVKALARSYMEQNRTFAESEMERFGIRAPQGAVSPTQATEADLHLEETQDLANLAKGFLGAKARMLTVIVGYQMVMDPRAGGLRTPVNFDPDPAKRPTFTEGLAVQNQEPPRHTWDEMKRGWDDADAALAAITAQNPTVYAALAQGGDAVTALATGTPEQARATAGQVLTTLHTNIDATIPRLDSGELDWRDLKPIHDQLYSGRTHAPSGTDWSGPVSKSVAQGVIGDHESTEFWISLGLGTAAAALFIVAEIASGGLATAALMGGLAISAGQATNSWANYATLADAAGSTATEQTRLVSQGQADAARLQAILDTVMALVDFAAPVVRAGRAAMAAARLDQALAARGVEAVLEHLPADAEQAARALQRGVAELGVDGTVRRTGQTIEQLEAALRGHPGSEQALERLGEARRLGIGTGAAGASAASAVTVTGTTAEEAWKAGRPLTELLADIPASVTGGRISRQFADQVVSEAVERLGPAEVLTAGGGWKRLSQVLTDESVAGRKFMAWRTSVFDDLERYVREELHGEVRRTGTATRFSNDIDMSFTGANAAEVQTQAAEYFARRVGIENSPTSFDRLMMAGLFTDPRRLHAYDVLPPAIRERVASAQAAKEEQLIWNRRLWEATEYGDEQLATTVRGEMQRLQVPEFTYRPLTAADRARLGRRVDGLYSQFEAALARNDLEAQERLAGQMADAQALINSAEGGGYFSAGGTRRFVSERPGEAGFPRLPGGTGQAIPSGERLTAMLDQLAKMDHSVLELDGSVDQIIAGIRGIGKYGGRLAEVSGEAGVGEAFGPLIERCAALKASAEATGLAGRLGTAEAEAIVRDARQAFDQVTRTSYNLLEQVRGAAQLPNVGNAMELIQAQTIAHVRLLRAVDVLMSNLELMVRAVRTATPLSQLGGSTPSGAPAPDSSLDSRYRAQPTNPSAAA